MEPQARRRLIGWGTACVIFLLLVWFIAVAASVASEASNLDAMLKKDVNDRKSIDQVQKELTQMGYTLAQAHTDSAYSATGPDHAFLVFHTWLQLALTTVPSQAVNGFHFDRDSSWLHSPPNP